MLEDDRVWIALKSTVQSVAIVVPEQAILTLTLAVTLNAGIRGKAVDWLNSDQGMIAAV
ncbi:hypothetical protein H6F87_18085 [Cyanobacteria bacterium FACHB-502]|nr:hypothetical protein [Cyanobacteria bacterium FACHB-502]